MEASVLIIVPETVSKYLNHAAILVCSERALQVVEVGSRKDARDCKKEYWGLRKLVLACTHGTKTASLVMRIELTVRLKCFSE